MAGHPIESLMRTTMESLKSMVDVNTVVGEPVETKDGTVIVPVSRVSFGFVAGGGDDAGESGGQGNSRQGQRDSEPDASGSSGEETLPFTGGSGAGVSVRPVGFLIVGTKKVRFIPVDNQAIYDRLLDEAPDLLERLATMIGTHEGIENLASRAREALREASGESGERRRRPRVRRHYGKEDDEDDEG